MKNQKLKKALQAERKKILEKVNKELKKHGIKYMSNCVNYIYYEYYKYAVYKLIGKLLLSLRLREINDAGFGRT